MGSHGIRDMAFYGRGIRDLPKKCHGIRDLKILRDGDNEQNLCRIRKMVYFNVGIRDSFIVRDGDAQQEH